MARLHAIGRFRAIQMGKENGSRRGRDRELGTAAQDLVVRIALVGSENAGSGLRQGRSEDAGAEPELDSGATKDMRRWAVLP